MVSPAAAAMVALLAAPAPETTAPASAPAPRRWGPARAGVAISAAAVGGWVAQRPLKMDFALRNTAAAAVTLPDPERTFGYLLIAQGRTVHYTERIFHARDLRNWPKRLAPGQVLRLPAVDVGRLEAFAYRPGLRLRGGYPAHVVAGRPVRPEPVGRVRDVLQPGPVRIKYLLYLDRRREGPLSLEGAVLKLSLELGDFARLSPARRKRVLAALAERMRKDAFSARAAYADAVRIGRPAVPTLTKVVDDERAPFFARMWAVTALSDIGDPAAAPSLIACLVDSTGGVRHAAAYHGVKLRSEKFDYALRKVAGEGSDPGVTAWAIRGLARFRGKVPSELMRAALAGPVKTRAVLVETIRRGRPDRADLPVLRRLVVDADGRVRATAARCLRQLGDASAATIQALISALEPEGEAARHAVAGALVALTGRPWTYPMDARPEEKRQILKQWRSWWAHSKSRWRK